MIANKKIELEEPTVNAAEPAAMSEDQILGQLMAGPKDVMAIGESLPEMQRARIAQFCYNKVHMRELGLRLASTCGLMSLKAAFGRAGDVVFQQSRNVDKTIGALKNSPGNQPPKPITLKDISLSK